MKLFTSFEQHIGYQDLIDAAFAVCHNNYGKTPLFNNKSEENVAKTSRSNSISSKEHIDDVLEKIREFDGTEEAYLYDDNVELWKSYLLGYINTFDKLTSVLPYSIATVFIGRQAVELAFKYLILESGKVYPKTHNLGDLAQSFLSMTDARALGYMDWVSEYCEEYCRYIEGGNAEYFRYPAYKSDKSFAGNRLDLRWLSYNFALILLKLIHYADLDDEFN